MITCRIVLLAAFSLYLATRPAMGQETDNGTEKTKMDSFHESVTERVLKMANKVDSYFGNERIEEDAQQTRIIVNLDYEMKEEAQDDFGGGISAKLSLPRLDNKWSLIVSGQDDDDLDEDDEEDRSVSIRFDARSSLRRHLAFDAGFKRRNSKYDLFGRMRGRKTIPGEKWVTRLDNKLYWFTDFGFELDSKLDFDRALPPTLLFRSRSRLRWYEDENECNDAFCPEQHFYIYQRMQSPRHALAYELNTWFETDPSDGSDDYLEQVRLRLRYRHNTRWDWLYMEMRPAITFPRYDDYDSQLSFLFRLEGIFGYNPKWESLEYGPERHINGNTEQD